MTQRLKFALDVLVIRSRVLVSICALWGAVLGRPRVGIFGRRSDRVASNLSGFLHFDFPSRSGSSARVDVALEVTVETVTDGGWTR
jgi:hypothetical protein